VSLEGKRLQRPAHLTFQRIMNHLKAAKNQLILVNQVADLSRLLTPVMPVFDL
jgi:hypothetical protein